jgi:hypothetical protein
MKDKFTPNKKFFGFTQGSYILYFLTWGVLNRNKWGFFSAVTVGKAFLSHSDHCVAEKGSLSYSTGVPVGRGLLWSGMGK